MINKQDFINAFNQNIEMVRGDTLAFNFILSGLNDFDYYNSFNVLFSVSEHYNEPIIIQSKKGDGISLYKYDGDKDEAIYSVYVAPEKTLTMDTGRYYYDLKIEDDTNTLTLMRGILTLIYNVE